MPRHFKISGSSQGTREALYALENRMQVTFIGRAKAFPFIIPKAMCPRACQGVPSAKVPRMCQGVPRMCARRAKAVARMCQGCAVPRPSAQGCAKACKDVRCAKDVPRLRAKAMCQGCAKDVPRMCQGCAKDVPRCQGCAKACKRAKRCACCARCWQDAAKDVARRARCAKACQGVPRRAKDVQDVLQARAKACAAGAVLCACQVCADAKVQGCAVLCRAKDVQGCAKDVPRMCWDVPRMLIVQGCAKACARMCWRVLCCVRGCARAARCVLRAGDVHACKVRAKGVCWDVQGAMLRARMCQGVPRMCQGCAKDVQGAAMCKDVPRMCDVRCAKACQGCVRDVQGRVCDVQGCCKACCACCAARAALRCAKDVPRCGAAACARRVQGVCGCARRVPRRVQGVQGCAARMLRCKARARCAGAAHVRARCVPRRVPRLCKACARAACACARMPRRVARMCCARAGACKDVPSCQGGQGAKDVQGGAGARVPSALHARCCCVCKACVLAQGVRVHVAARWRKACCGCCACKACKAVPRRAAGVLQGCARMCHVCKDVQACARMCQGVPRRAKACLACKARWWRAKVVVVQGVQGKACKGVARERLNIYYKGGVGVEAGGGSGDATSAALSISLLSTATWWPLACLVVIGWEPPLGMRRAAARVVPSSPDSVFSAVRAECWPPRWTLSVKRPFRENPHFGVRLRGKADDCKLVMCLQP
ncbi:hypothetical protein Syun_006771 [Stephania yunnanensis]|uniref:Uncharacterized protein n=1 Tax=Stephania yunnanensis TaxID=152371 RepID=A0AAP0KY82_9MAGN